MKRLAGLALVAAVSCTPALREPPALATLSTHPPSASGSEPANLVGAAEAAWAKRPDIASVRQAESLFLRAAQADEQDVAGLIGAVRTKAWLADHGGTAKERQALAVSAVQAAQWCARRKPDDTACDYWLGIAVGLQAREIRATADDGMKTMVVRLQRAIDADPSYDDAGPQRVMALLRARAPSWPLGPGDVEQAVEQAQAAVALRPDYPPNLMALGETLAAAKQKGEARDAYTKARALAVTKRDAGDPDAAEWVTGIDATLAKMKP